MSAAQPPRVWLAPMLIALITAVGLVSALVGDGLWDMLSWFALGLPVFVFIGFWLRRL